MLADLKIKIPAKIKKNNLRYLFFDLKGLPEKRPEHGIDLCRLLSLTYFIQNPEISK